MQHEMLVIIVLNVCNDMQLLCVGTVGCKLSDHFGTDPVHNSEYL